MKISKLLNAVGPNLFEWQVETLCERGYNEVIRRHDLAHLREKSLRVTTDGKEHIPFLLVFPQNIMPIAQQMSGIIIGGKFTTRPVKPNEIPTDVRYTKGLEIPTNPYLICDIDTNLDQVKVCQPTGDERAKSILEKGRSPLTIEEGISLVTHFPQLLWGSGVVVSLYGSRSHWDSEHHGHQVQVQGISRERSATVYLGFSPSHMPWEGFMVPSCSSRIT